MVQLTPTLVQAPQNNVLGSYLQGRQLRQQEDQLRKAEQRQEGIQQARAAAIGGDETAIGILAGYAPEEAVQVQNYLKNIKEADRKKLAAGNEAVLRELLVVDSLPEDKKGTALFEAAERLEAQGIPVAASLQGITPQNVGQMVRQFAIRTKSLDELLKTPTPLSKPGKLQADIKAGLITPEQAAQDLEKTPLVQIMNEGEKSEQKELGKLRAQRYGKIIEDAGNASNTLERVNSARLIAGRSELPSDLQAIGGEVATFMGLDPDRLPILGDITSGQTFNATIKDLVLEKMATQKGPQTDRDAARIEKTLARLGNTAEARDFLLRSSAMFAGSDILKADFYQEYQDNEGSLRGAEKAWRKASRNMPLLKEHPNKVSADGKPAIVFLHEFIQQAQAANPDATISEIIDLWKQ